MEYTESALVEGIKAKDVPAYNYMINKYTKTIYYLAYNILSPSLNKEDIEECVSDVFLDAWRKIDEFDQEKGNFRTWLLVLTKYKSLTYKRKKATRNLVDIEAFQIEDNYNLEKQFFLRQDQEKVIEVINSFNAIDKEIFFRRYLEVLLKKKKNYQDRKQSLQLRLLIKDILKNTETRFFLRSLKM